MRALEIDGLGHAYGATPVLDVVSFHIDAGERVALLGASGAGKTTVLRAIAGLLTPERGSIAIGGRVVSERGHERVPVEARRVGLVFQEYALFPYQSVAENVGFGLGRPDPERVRALLALVGLEGLGGRRPAALSGGQQQRVAIARALAPRPALLLLDEPFANVDTAKKQAVALEIAATLRAEGASALIVTHDRGDALSLADRLVILEGGPRGGRVAQIGPPEDVYARPESRAVAELTGPASFLEAEAEGSSARSVIGRVALLAPRQGRVDLVLRPEQLRFTPGDGDARVEGSAFLGSAHRLRVRLGERTLDVDTKARVPSDTRGALSADGPIWALP